MRRRLHLIEVLFFLFLLCYLPDYIHLQRILSLCFFNPLGSFLRPPILGPVFFCARFWWVPSFRVSGSELSGKISVFCRTPYPHLCTCVWIRQFFTDKGVPSSYNSPLLDPLYLLKTIEVPLLLAENLKSEINCQGFQRLYHTWQSTFFRVKCEL